MKAIGNVVLLCTAMLCSVAQAASALAAETTPDAPVATVPSNPWTSVTLVAHLGPFHARVSVEAEVVDRDPAVAAAGVLADCPKVDARDSERRALIRLTSVTDAPFSAPRRTVALVDPVHGLLQLESWQGKSHVLHRDCVDGRHSTRWLIKKKGEELLRTRDSPVSAACAGLPVVDGTSLAWFASAHGLDREGVHLDVAAWSGAQLLAVRLEAREICVLPREDQPSIQARRVSVGLRDEPDDDDDDAAAGPFGMTGDMSLWLEIGSGRVLALEGRARKVGRVRAVNPEAGIR